MPRCFGTRDDAGGDVDAKVVEGSTENGMTVAEGSAHHDAAPVASVGFVEAGPADGGDGATVDAGQQRLSGLRSGCPSVQRRHAGDVRGRPVAERLTVQRPLAFLPPRSLFYRTAELRPRRAGAHELRRGERELCTSLAVTGGTYDRTYDSVGLAADGGSTVTLAADGGPTGEADPATVSSFRLDNTT